MTRDTTGTTHRAGRATAGLDPAAQARLMEQLRAAVRALWDRGWEPADVVRAAGRLQRADAARHVRDVIADELAGYGRGALPTRWRDQLETLEASVWWPRDVLLPGALVARGATWDEALGALQATRSVLEALRGLPPLSKLGPAPGEVVTSGSVDGSADGAGDGSGGRPGQVDPKVLERVRLLLAKAESTPYPEEAETFTAGAQALMARHSIDAALLDAAGPRDLRAGPAARRIGIDNPYESPKVTLLAAIAAANRVRAVWSRGLGFCTVVGFAADLDAVELLYTSLLVQATSAMRRDGPRDDGRGAGSTRSFRHSFLLAFADRIGERLDEAARAAEREAAALDGGANLLPVLADRSTAVEQLTDELFPAVRQRRGPTVSHPEGWYAGRAAADRAQLGPRRMLPDGGRG